MQCNNCGELKTECKLKTVCSDCRCSRCDRLKMLCECEERKIMKSAKTMRDARHHRIELILLGMALANQGDRQKVLDSVTTDDFNSENVAKCMNAIRTGSESDIGSMKEVFDGWGIDISESKAIDACISRLKDNAKIRKIEDTFENFYTNWKGRCTDVFMKKAEEAARSLQEILNREDYHDAPVKAKGE